MGEISFRKGDMVNVNFLYNNFNPEYFSDPDTFDPNRWTNKENTLSEPYAFTPFSAGPRNCIGQHLAMIEARIMICELLSRYEIHIDKDYELRMTLKFLYEAVDPILVGLTAK